MSAVVRNQAEWTNNLISKQLNLVLIPASIHCNKDGNKEREVQVQALQGRKIEGCLKLIMNGRSVIVCDSIVLATLTYMSETWIWNKSQRYRIQAGETSYLKGVCGVNMMDNESKESVNGRLVMLV